MSDPWSSTATLDGGVLRRMADVLEIRGADPQQAEMAERYLLELDPKPGAKIAELGCGVGVLTRRIARLYPTCDVLGVDPSPVLVDLARERATAYTNLTFAPGDARELTYRDEEFDAIIFHTTLCHIPNPLNAIREATRVLKKGGVLCAFDGDYLTTTVATTEGDPLQGTVSTMIENFVENKWLTRHLAHVLRSEGFRIETVRSHGFVQTNPADYLLTMVDRGADLMVASGKIETSVGEELKAEARRRVAEGSFFGHIAFLSVRGVKL